jgi:hypothetical protein
MEDGIGRSVCSRPGKLDYERGSGEPGSDLVRAYLGSINVNINEGPPTDRDIPWQASNRLRPPQRFKARYYNTEQSDLIWCNPRTNSQFGLLVYCAPYLLHAFICADGMLLTIRRDAS